MERETDTIVHVIQDFLSTLRNTEEVLDLKTVVNKISVSCDRVIDTGNSMLKEQGEGIQSISKNVKYVLEDLEMYSRRLCSYFNEKSPEFIKGKLDKIAKQRLAASAYDVAKSTKELVALLDI